MRYIRYDIYYIYIYYIQYYKFTFHDSDWWLIGLITHKPQRDITQNLVNLTQLWRTKDSKIRKCWRWLPLSLRSTGQRSQSQTQYITTSQCNQTYHETSIRYFTIRVDISEAVLSASRPASALNASCCCGPWRAAWDSRSCISDARRLRSACLTGM